MCVCVCVCPLKVQILGHLCDASALMHVNFHSVFFAPSPFSLPLSISPSEFVYLVISTLSPAPSPSLLVKFLLNALTSVHMKEASDIRPNERTALFELTESSRKHYEACIRAYVADYFPDGTFAVRLDNINICAFFF